jgi:D-aspartate ligase
LALAPTVPYPILIKPRTHVHRIRNDKGVVVHSKSELIQQYQQFVTRERNRAADHPLLPDAGIPILQPLVDVARRGVHSITGFIDRTGELFVTRRSTKVFQRSEPAGVGVCFESLPTDPVLSNAVYRLCRELGYFGIFEVEFLWFDGHWVAIDFNPRFFNQMGMDIHRRMPLPLLACLDAAGYKAALRDAVAKAQAEDEASSIVFYDRFTLGAILFAQIIASRISREDRAYWRAWTKQNAAFAVDVASDPSDWAPGIVHALSEVYLGLRAIPRFLRSASPMSHARAPIAGKVRS